MLTEENIRTIVRDEVERVVTQQFQLAFGALLTSGLEPIVEGVSELLNQRQRLATMEESLGLLVESQARVERAVADATGSGDEDEPWRQSLRDDDVVLDDDD